MAIPAGGKVRTPRGEKSEHECPICKGSGAEGESVCEVCQGKGVVEMPPRQLIKPRREQ